MMKAGRRRRHHELKEVHMPVDPAKIAACEAAAQAGTTLSQTGAALAAKAAQEKSDADAGSAAADAALAAATAAAEGARTLAAKAAADLAESQSDQANGGVAQQSAGDAKVLYFASDVCERNGKSELAAALAADADSLLARAQALVAPPTSTALPQ